MGVPEVPVICRLSRCFPFRARCAFSKRTASPALTAAVLAESPLANSVSEREANDQADSNFQHSDSAEGRRDPARANNTAQGRGLGNPLSSALVTCFMRVRLGNAAFCGRVPFGPTWMDSCCTVKAHSRSGSRSPCLANSIGNFNCGISAID
jgi:hypothetical protein